MSNGKRFAELDGLRGIAAVAVVFYHYLVRYHEIYGQNHSALIEFSWLHYGVHLFFGISGFVIYYTIDNKGVGTQFIIARIARLYPGYLVALMITFFVVLAFGLPGREKDFTTLLSNLLIFHSFLGFDSVDGVYWTLSYEVVFYSLIFTMCKLSTQVNLFYKFSWLYLFVALNILNFSDNVFFIKVLDKLFIFKYLPYFLLGMFAYEIREKVSLEKSVTLLGVLIVNFLIVPDWYVLCILAVLFVVVVKGYFKFLANKYLMFLGAISYSLYLIHQNIGYIILNKLVPAIGYLLSVCFAVLISIAISVVLHKYFEIPGKDFVFHIYKKVSGRFKSS